VHGIHEAIPSREGLGAQVRGYTNEEEGQSVANEDRDEEEFLYHDNLGSRRGGRSRVRENDGGDISRSNRRRIDSPRNNNNEENDNIGDGSSNGSGGRRSSPSSGEDTSQS